MIDLRSWMQPALSALLCLYGAVAGAGGPGLINGGFEQRDADGAPLGWTILHGLDPHGYGEPDYSRRFDEVIPGIAAGGYLSSMCLGFPARGAWMCPVFQHENGDNQGRNGKLLGKAAAYQTATMPPGTYRFAAYLRTLEGDLFAAAFALGYSLGDAPRYAHDASTGIRWTRQDLAMRRDEKRGPEARGEWARYATEPFTLDREGPVTVWIRFNYANENQFLARWQADDAALELVQPTPPPVAARCAPIRPPERRRMVCGSGDEPYLVGAGGAIVDASHIRLFRTGRLLQAGERLVYRFPELNRPSGLWIVVHASGEAVVRARGGRYELRGHVAIERPLPVGGDGDTVEIEARAPTEVYDLELSTLPRTAWRVAHVEPDIVGVPWMVGVWDAQANEFQGANAAFAVSAWPDHAAPPPGGRWELSFEHRPEPGRRYLFVHGLLHGKATYDVGGDGVIDWAAGIIGQEIVEFDVTDLLAAGSNTVVIELDEDARHDFAALATLCPDARHNLRIVPDDDFAPLPPYQLVFEGTELADRHTEVIRNSWFWLHELHYEPTGFVDASVPRGKWFNQYWPVDIAFALREWTRWGRHDESVTIAKRLAEVGWHGHESNRSGGWDNTGGAILVVELVEVLRRAGLDATLAEPLWQRLLANAEEVIAAASASPFDGLIRGTNWENAGNLEHGPCYALSTTLGLAAGLLSSASLAEDLGRGETAPAWRAVAARMRAAAKKHLVLEDDHVCPTGFVLPRGTWAYGLRPDGTIEDQPLAGYLWSGGAMADVLGPSYYDAELTPIYSRTLDAALPLFERNEPGVVSGYATSYDGPDAAINTAVVADRVNDLALLVLRQSDEFDIDHDGGATHAELSRWASGRAGWAEDTNLVCAASYLWGVRALAGIDDVLRAREQLTLAPRLPRDWTGMRIQGWPVRYRRADGVPAWTTLFARLARDERGATLTARSSEAVPGFQARLGPFPPGTAALEATLDGALLAVTLERSGDAAWGWVTADLGPRPVVLRVVITAAR